MHVGLTDSFNELIKGAIAVIDILTFIEPVGISSDDGKNLIHSHQRSAWERGLVILWNAISFDILIYSYV